MRYPLILLLLCATGFPLHAQAPGYMGKRLSFNAEGSSMIVLLGPTANNRGSQDRIYGDNGGGFALSWRAAGQFGYALSRKNQLSLAIDYTKTGMVLDNVLTPSLYDVSGTYNYDNHYLFYNLSALTARLGMRFYKTKKAAIAPLGNYNGWSLNATRVSGKILDKRTAYAYNGDLGHAPLGIDPVKTLLSISYESGANWIIADRILLNFGTRITVPLRMGHWIGIATDGYDYTPENYGSYQEANQLHFEDEALRRLSAHSLLSFYAGVGLLLF